MCGGAGKTPGKLPPVRHSHHPGVWCWGGHDSTHTRRPAAHLGEEHGVISELLRYRRRRWQTEKNGRRESRSRDVRVGSAPAEETETAVETERLRLRGGLGIRPDLALPGGSTSVQLVPPVRRHRLQDPEGERGAVPSLRKLGPSATSRRQQPE